MNELNDNIKRLQQGDEDAFTFLYERFEAGLANHLYRMLGNRERAEEVFQEVMITMIKKINFYEQRDDLENSFKAWLFRIATNRAIDELRRGKVKKIKDQEMLSRDIAESVINDDFADEMMSKDLSKKLGELVMSLSIIQRTFLTLKIKEDLSLLEIATICDCNVNTVKQGLFRARKSLKNLIIQEGIML